MDIGKFMTKVPRIHSVYNFVLSLVLGQHKNAWRKIPIGGDTEKELVRKLSETAYKVGQIQKVGIQITDYARLVAKEPHCIFPREVENAEFAIGTLDELFKDLFGSKKVTELKTFLNETFLAKHGFEVCKPRDAYYLRCAYTDQPLGERVCVGTKPIPVYALNTMKMQV
jgi:hypothetical protein